MNRDELKQHIQGTMATVPTAMNDRYEIDYGLMAEMTRWWVDQGLVTGKAPIKVAAAMGEGPDLTDDEWPRLLKTVVDAAGDKATIMCGLKPKDTIHTIEDAKRAQDLGAVGLQIDLPFFHHPTQDDYVRFYTDISDAIDIGIMIYNTFNFGAPSITAETMLRLADAEHVVAVKWFVPAEGGPDYDDMREFSHIFNVIDNSLQPVRAFKNGAAGYINNTVHAYPAHELHVLELLRAGKYEEADAEFNRVSKPIREFMAKLSKKSGGYRASKAMMDVIGHPFGPPRPPSLPLSNEELLELHGIMSSFGWELPDPSTLGLGVTAAD